MLLKVKTETFEPFKIAVNISLLTLVQDESSDDDKNDEYGVVEVKPFDKVKPANEIVIIKSNKYYYYFLRL